MKKLKKLFYYIFNRDKLKRTKELERLTWLIEQQYKAVGLKYRKDYKYKMGGL